jgi:hypothetical protein
LKTQTQVSGTRWVWSEVLREGRRGQSVTILTRRDTSIQTRVVYTRNITHGGEYCLRLIRI